MLDNSVEKPCSNEKKVNTTTPMEIFFCPLSTVFPNVNVLYGLVFYLEIAKLLFSMVSNLSADSKPTDRYLLVFILPVLIRFYVHWNYQATDPCFIITIKNKLTSR